MVTLDYNYYLDCANFPKRFIREIKGKIKATPAIILADKYLSNFYPESFLLAGNANTGKTFAITWIAYQLFRRRIIEDHYSILFLHAFDIQKSVLENGDWDFTFHGLVYKDIKILVLDDLGVERASSKIVHENQDKVGLLYELLNYRLTHDLTTLITTNLTSEKDISSRYGERVTSRLQRWGVIEMVSEGKTDEEFIDTWEPSLKESVCVICSSKFSQPFFQDKQFCNNCAEDVPRLDEYKKTVEERWQNTLRQAKAEMAKLESIASYDRVAQKDFEEKRQENRDKIEILKKLDPKFRKIGR